MVTALDSGASGPGSSPGRARHFILTVPLSTQVECNAGGDPAMDKHPIQGGVEILLVASCYRNWGKPWPDVPQLARM